MKNIEPIELTIEQLDRGLKEEIDTLRILTIKEEELKVMIQKCQENIAKYRNKLNPAESDINVVKYKPRKRPLETYLQYKKRKETDGEIPYWCEWQREWNYQPWQICNCK